MGADFLSLNQKFLNKLSVLKPLNKNLKENENQKANLVDSLKMCPYDNVKRSIFEEINILKIENTRIKDEIAKITFVFDK